MYPPYQNPNKQPQNENWYTGSNLNPQTYSSAQQPNAVPFAMNQINVSPEMINYGLSAGQNILQNQADRLSPGFSSTWASLKYYFQVNNTYVVKKILRILYPVKKSLSWSRSLADNFDKDAAPGNFSSKWAVPSLDENGPDLYIPLMSFVTYVLLYGLCRASSITNFTPEIIIQAIYRGLILQLIESCVIKFGVNMMSVTLPFLDVFSYTGYKYVGLCINLVSRVLGSTANFFVSLYTASMLGYFIMKTMAGVVPESAAVTGPPRPLLLVAFAAMQFLIVFVLSWM